MLMMYLTCFSWQFLTTTSCNVNPKDINDLTDDMISKTLLLLKKIEIQVCKNQKTITSMKLIHADQEDLEEMLTN